MMFLHWGCFLFFFGGWRGRGIMGASLNITIPSVLSPATGNKGSLCWGDLKVTRVSKIFHWTLDLRVFNIPLYYITNMTTVRSSSAIIKNVKTSLYSLNWWRITLFSLYWARQLVLESQDCLPAITKVNNIWAETTELFSLQCLNATPFSAFN